MNKAKFRKKIERNNKIAASVISISGYGVIFSIVALFAFLLYETIPLFYSADVTKTAVIQPEKSNSQIILSGIDQYKELVYTINNSGIVSFYSLADKAYIKIDTVSLLKDEKILTSSISKYSPENISLASSKGRIFDLNLKARYKFIGSKRHIIPSMVLNENFGTGDVVDSSVQIVNLAFDINDDGIKYWAWSDSKQDLYLRIYDEEEDESQVYNLTEQPGHTDFSALVIDAENQILIAGNKSGELFSFDISDADEPVLKDNWKASNNAVTKLEFLIGGNTLIVGDSNGKVES